MGALLPQHFQRAIHVGVSHFHHRPCHLHLGKIAQLDIGVDLEGGGEHATLLRRETRIAGHRQTVRVHGFAEGLLEGIG